MTVPKIFSDEGYPERFCKGAPTMREAFECCKAEGVVVAANGSWYRVIEGEGEERVKRADFEFLVVSEDNRPVEFTATFSSEDGRWNSEKKDLTDELETMEDEGKVAKSVQDRLVDDVRAISAVKDKIALLCKNAPHVRLTMLSFSLSDEEFEVPAWRIEAKNWPIISYLNKSRERSKSVKAVIDALSGKVLSYKEA